MATHGILGLVATGLTILMMSGDPQAVPLRWDDTVNPPDQVAGYVLEQSPKTPKNWREVALISPAERTFTVPGVPPGEWCFRMKTKARDGALDSDYSNEFCLWVLRAPVDISIMGRGDD